MRSRRLVSVVAANLVRSRDHFLLASIGIVVGIATFAFFMSLGLGVRSVVLGKIFPLDQLEVIPKSLDLDLGPLRLGTGADAITDTRVEEIRALPGVGDVYPKMRLTVPSTGVGGEEILGADLRSELVADGIEPELVTEDIEPGYEFRDFDDPEDPRNSDPPRTCQTDNECGEHRYCGIPVGKTLKPGELRRALRNDRGDPGNLPTERVCRSYIPILASDHIVELYNGALRRAHGFPQLNPDIVLGFKFDITLGSSMVQASRKDRVLHEKGMLVGFSSKAIALGITMPIGYAKRFNVAFGSPDDAKRFHSVIVNVPSKDDVALVAKGVEDLNLEVADTGAEQAALLIAIFMAVFGLISAVIVGISAVNIMHVFFMLVYERQHELGIMRAVGASRGDIARIILGEAAAMGLAAGVMGLLTAYGAAELFDWMSVQYIPDFPYKPQTYFRFPLWLIGSAVAFSMSFCVLGAFLPARRAAKLEPARILTGQ